MSDELKDIKKPELDALAEARKLTDAICKWIDPDETENTAVQLSIALSTLAIAERLDTLSNDVAAIANMMTDFLQEREAERNRAGSASNYRGAGPAT